MICKTCHKAGYNMALRNNQPWCGSCTNPGEVRTISQTNTYGRTGGMSYGGLSALPPIANLNEWREIVALCKKVSGPRLLMEDGPIKTLPLPDLHNPLTGNKQEAGWSPLQSYIDGITNISQSKSTSKLLYEG